DDVEHDPHPRVADRLREQAELRLATKGVRQLARVDHVVPVRRSRTRLECWREIEVRDAQVAEIGNEGARLREAEMRVELKAIGRPQLGSLAHADRLRITTECEITVSGLRAWKETLPGSAFGSAVDSSSAHWAPNRLRGSRNSRSSPCALNRTRNESS